jgi:lysyl-tRNA synthetase class 2
MMECYQAYADYADMMELTQSMLQQIANTVLGSTRIPASDANPEIELAGHWPRLEMRVAIARATGVDVLTHRDLAALRAAVKQAGLECPEVPTWGRLVDELFSAHVESTLIQPCFIVDYPVELSPLAKRKPDDPRLVERFEAYLGGMEVANAFSELNDPDDQRERLLASRQDLAAGDDEAHPLDEDFLAALEVGMPPTGGLGVGVDRLVMLLVGAPSLREVIAFPHMRPSAGDED